ncbi:MAG: hypothetical protein LV473_04335 [Nitrospira sp.]|nr:hypothetical protein [Nitrospira sp.]
MTVNYKGTIVEIPPEGYPYVTQADLKPCYTITEGYDAQCVGCLEAASAFWEKASPLPLRSHPQGGVSQWSVPAVKQRVEDECFMMLTCADP